MICNEIMCKRSFFAKVIFFLLLLIFIIVFSIENNSIFDLLYFYLFFI